MFNLGVDTFHKCFFLNIVDFTKYSVLTLDTVQTATGAEGKMGPRER